MPDNETLRVARGERLILSKESPQFRENYRQIRPRTASEIREVLGPSVEAARALRKSGAPTRRSLRSADVAVEDLESKDESVRARAHQETGAALESFVYDLRPRALSRMQPVFAKYLENRELVIEVAVLPDIEVEDGGTMVIPEDTHVVRANRIILHGTATLLLLGNTKIEANSIVGTTP
jgi:hypothetical protein